MDDRRKILLNKGRSETYINKNVDIKIDIDNTARPLPVNDVDTKISAFEQSQQERSESTIYRFYGFVSPLISNPLYNDNIKIFSENGTIKSNKIISNEIYEKDGWLGYYQDKSLSDDQNVILLQGNYSGPAFSSNIFAKIQFPTNTDLSHLSGGQGIQLTYTPTTTGIETTTGFIVGVVNDAQDFIILVDIPQYLFNSFPCNYILDNQGIEIAITSGNGYSMDDNGQAAIDTLCALHISILESYLDLHPGTSIGDGCSINYDGCYGITNVTASITLPPEPQEYNDNKSSLCEFSPFDPGYDRLSFLDDDGSPNYLMKITYPVSTKNDVELVTGVALSEGLPIIEKTTVRMNGRDYTGLRTPLNHGLSKGDQVVIYNATIVTPNALTPTPLGIGSVVLDLNGVPIGEIPPPTPGYSIGITGAPAILFLNQAGGTVYQSYTILYGGGPLTTKTFSVTRAGNQTNSDVARTFVIDIDPTLVNVSVGATTLKRKVGGKESDYYVRVFSALTETYTDYDMYPAAYGTNYFNDKQVAFNFKVDVDVGGIVDNLGRPLSELFLTIVKNNEDGSLSNINTQYWSDIQNAKGLTTDFWRPIQCGYEIGNPGDTSVQYNIRALNDIAYPQVYFNNIDESDKNFIGDIVEYNEGELLERILETPYHRINTVYREHYDMFGPTIQIGDNLVGDIDGEETTISTPTSKKEGYIYKPHNRIVIREYSSYIETGIEGQVINIPDYAVNAYEDPQPLVNATGTTITKRWRDLLSVGFVDIAGNGVDYPFESGAHYVFLNSRFYFQRQDPACEFTFVNTILELPPDKEIFYSIMAQPSYFDYNIINAELFTSLNVDDITDLGGIALTDEVKYGYLRAPKHKCQPFHFKTFFNMTAGNKTLTKPSGAEETRFCAAKSGWVKNQGGLNQDFKDESSYECEADDAWDQVANKTTKVYQYCDLTDPIGQSYSNFCLEAAGVGEIAFKKSKDASGACVRYLQVEVRSVIYNGEYELGQVDTAGACIDFNFIEVKNVDDVC